jgi:hypothetical protein
MVYDLDSKLQFPVNFTTFKQNAIRYNIELPKELERLKGFKYRHYRVVPGRLYLDHFASDRSHMVLNQN